MKFGMVLKYVTKDGLIIEDIPMQFIKNKEELTELFASILDGFSFDENQDLNKPPW